MSVNESLVTTGNGAPVVKTAGEEAYERLNTRQRKFIETYLSNGFIGWKAAQTAGYSGEMMVLAATASKLLRHPNVRAIMNERLMEAAMPANEVLHRISQIAGMDLTDYLDEDTGKVDVKKLKASGRGFAVKKYKTKSVSKVVARGYHDLEPGGRDGVKGAKEEIESSVVFEDSEVETYSALDALNTLLKVHGLAGGVQVNLTLTPDQVKSLTDEELDDTIAKLERSLGRGR
jgi:hypothetical protein